jgi:AraC-like DNA-binding protein
VEILCLDSVGATYREYGGAEIQIGIGVSVNRGQDVEGELIFLPDIPVRGTRIVIDEDFFISLQTGISSRVSPGSGDSGMTLGTNVHDPELPLVFGQIKRAIKRDFDQKFYYENKISEVIYLLAHSDLAKNKQKESLKHLSLADIKYMDRVMNIIKTRISDPPTMAELSRLVSASEAKLHSDFITAYGCTIHDYAQKIRMAEALRKIENSDEPLYSIARGVGYKHPGHFAAIFRNTYGVTPSEYVKIKNPGNKRRYDT